LDDEVTHPRNWDKCPLRSVQCRFYRMYIQMNKSLPLGNLAGVLDYSIRIQVEVLT
jgi:hypothetical protein